MEMKTFSGTPTITPEKIDTLKQWYSFAFANVENEILSPAQISYYTGVSDGFGSSLTLLYDAALANSAKTVEVVKKTRHLGLKRMIFAATVTYIVLDGRLTKKIKKEVAKAQDKRNAEDNAKKYHDEAYKAYTDKP